MFRYSIQRHFPEGSAFSFILLPLLLLPCDTLHAAFQEQEALQTENSLVQTRGRPLGELLNADGTVNLESGFRGSIDATGYRLVSGAGEAPRFVMAFPEAAPGDEYWQPGFGPPQGVSDRVRALALDSTGNLYAGGDFTTAGGLAANHIAKWDGSAWSALGSGMNGWVYALAVDSADNLWVGGWFTTAGDKVSSRIALYKVPGGGEGCSRRYWKRKRHFDSWPTPYVPGTIRKGGTPFAVVFEDAFPNKSLSQVLRFRDGALKKLGREAVAALLNAASSEVSYDLTVQEVIDLFNQTYPSKNCTYRLLKKDLRSLNRQVCPLNGEGN